MARGSVQAGIESFRDFYGLTAVADTVAYVDTTVYLKDDEPLRMCMPMMRATQGAEAGSPTFTNIGDAIRFGVFDQLGDNVNDYRIDDVIFRSARREFRKRSREHQALVFGRNAMASLMSGYRLSSELRGIHG